MSIPRANPWLLGALFGLLATGLGFAQPRLTVATESGQVIRLSWEDAVGEFSLESRSTWTPGSDWRSANLIPLVQGSSHTVTLPVTGEARFYRLRGGPVSPVVLETSPAPGETGVAVTRETVFRFSSPLATNAVLTGNQLYAEFAGRKVLSRVEVSPDRRAATLFHLENLPGQARVRVSLHGSGVPGASGLDLDANGDGQPGGTLALEFETAALTGLPDTGVIGYVYASERTPDGANVPLQNVIVTVDGAEESLRTTTDANGFFRLQPSPAGRFFVHVDGRTALGSVWPGGAYYPFVGKAWEAAPGQTNNRAGGSGEIFLPLVPGDALQPVSATTETRITFSPSVLATNPSLAGVEIRVPPNALFSENGTRGGRVGLAAVPPDRLPEPLPPGLEGLPLVITIQTDGPLNFDRPVPVRFPNLPDPTTGVLLPPGAKTVLWSFNHDTGHWEPQGTATITADGLYAETDPGVGVRQPGWHGINPNTWPDGPDEDDDDNDEDHNDDDDNDKHDDDCHRTVICQTPGERQSGAHCILECSTDAIKDLLCPLNPFCDEEEVHKPERSPVELGLCVGDPIGCQGQTQSVDGVFRHEAYDDMLIQRDKDCMDECMFPSSTPFPMTVPCHIVDPCPDVLPFSVREGGSLATHGAPQPPPSPADLADAIPLDWLREQRALWHAEGDYYSRVLGNPRILETAPVELKLWRKFFREAKAAAEPDTEAGRRFSPAEKGALVTLPRPSQLTPEAWSALVDRLDLMLGNVLPPAEWDAAGIQAAAELTVAVRRELLDRGWRYRLDGLVNGLLLTSKELSVPVGSPAFPARAHYYLLINLSNGFEIRGRLSSSGRFENIALAPNTIFSVGYLDPETGAIAAAVLQTQGVGRRSMVPTAPFEPDSSLDQDADGLSDLAETIAGTFVNQPDSDGDGLSDAEELRQGGNPLDGLARPIGAIASTGGTGITLDVAVQRDVAVTIGTGVGLTLYDVSRPNAPVLINRFTTDGDFTSLALQWPLVLVANLSTRATLYQVDDVTQPPRRLWQGPTGAQPRAVALGFGYAYVAGNTVQVYELDQGDLAHEIPTNGYVALRLDGDYLYAIRSSTKHFLDVFRLLDAGRTPVLQGTTDWSANLAPLETEPPFFAAEGLAYAGFLPGYHVIDVSDPAAPAVVGGVGVLTGANHAVAPDGGGAMATVTSFAGPSSLQVGIYSTADPTVTTNLLVAFDTPGNPRRVSPYRGRLYIGDSQAGLTVANYRGLDLGTNPPTLQLIAYPRLHDPDRHESGEWLRVQARAQDNVVVREVEFYVDGAWRDSVGTYPFATDLRAPTLSPEKPSFTLQARAWDTAGYFTWSSVITVGLTNELRRPRLTAFTPSSGTRFLTNTLVSVTAAFNEPLTPATWDAGWQIVAAGPDQRFGTADDALLPSTVTALNATNYTLAFEQPLPEGFYLVTATTNLTDVHGNPLRDTVSWEFGIRPRVTFIGLNNLWNQDPSTGTNWSGGALPTTNDLVEIDLPAGRTLVARQRVAAYRLRVGSPIRFEGGEFRLGDHARFGHPVFAVGQTVWAGGESDILNSLYFGDPPGNNNSFLDAHVLNNHGTVTLEKGASSGLLLRTTGGRPVGIRNLPGATWINIRGAIVGTGSPSFFENDGVILKTGPVTDWIAVDHFVNLGTIEVREGALEFSGGGSGFNEEHLGNYRVEAGARLSLRSASSTYGRSTRIHGGGDVDLNGHNTGMLFPGSLEVGGTVQVLSGDLNFAGAFHATGTLSVVSGTTRFTGLAPRAGLVVNRGDLIIASGTPMVLGGLINSNVLDVGTALEVHGSARFHGGRLRGVGRLRANGPVTFGGTIRETFFVGTQGRFELAGPAVCESNAVVDTTRFDVRILPGGGLDLGSANEFRLGLNPILNEGTLEKTGPGHTRLRTGLDNRGTVRITAGSVTFDGSPVIQTAGLLSLNSTSIVLLTQSRALDLRGGRMEGAATLFCNAVTNGALIAPGMPVGTLDLQLGTHPTFSVYQQTPAGRLQIDLGGPEPGVSHDVLKLTGRAVLNGTLEIITAPGYDPPLDQTFTIVTAGRAIEGTFATLLGDTLPTGKRFEVEYATNAVALRVVTAP